MCVMKQKQAWVLILNWQNAKDTIECLDSIFKSNDGCIAGVVVCDNGSKDSSLMDIRSWFCSQGIQFLNLSYKNNKFTGLEDETKNRVKEGVVLIENGQNLGFAWGNNVGLKFIIEVTDYEYVYVLNNDTVINSTTVSALVEYCEQNSEIGMCGNKVIYYYEPEKVQAYSGASFNPVLGRAKHLGALSLVSEKANVKEIEASLDYILGASLMLSKACLEKVGFMEESYFLYYEEIDWAVRAKKAGFRLGFAKNSSLLHKEGGSVGSNVDKNKRSTLSSYYLIRSRIKFTLKFYPYYLPTVFLFSASQMFRELFRANFKGFIVMLRACLGFSFK